MIPLKRKQMNTNKENSQTVCLTIDGYDGLWYEIGWYSSHYRSKVFKATAEYIPRNGYWKVIRRWMEEKTKRTEYCRVFPDTGMNIFKSTVYRLWSFRQPYSIIEKDEENFNWAVVSNRKYSQLWILSRKPQISDEILRPIIYNLVDKGINTAKIIWTSH